MVPLVPFVPTNPTSPCSPTGPVSPKGPQWPLLPWRIAKGLQHGQGYCLAKPTFGTGDLFEERCLACGAPSCLLLTYSENKLPWMVLALRKWNDQPFALTFLFHQFCRASLPDPNKRNSKTSFKVNKKSCLISGLKEIWSYQLGHSPWPLLVREALRVLRFLLDQFHHHPRRCHLDQHLPFRPENSRKRKENAFLVANNTKVQNTVD